MSKEEIIGRFLTKPYLMEMGAGKLAKYFNVTPDTIRSIKNIIRSNMVDDVVEVKNSPKILVLDIETAPMKAFVWKRWKENISLDQTISEWFMICWSAKFIGSDNVITGCLTRHEIIDENDSRITRMLWDVLDEADIVIAHNGKKFDIPKINSRFIIHGLPPTSTYIQIDTKEVAAKQFGFSSNKLDALAGYFNIEHKSKTDFSLWVDCLNGNEDALDYMLNYNIKDVLILEKVYMKLRPWIKSHPNHSLFNESDQLVCPHCGSHKLHENGNYYTNTGRYLTYRCESCGAVSRARKNNLNKRPTEMLVGIPGR